MANKIKNALISVSDKGSLKDLLKVLKKNNVNIISSGGTYKSIKKLGFKCKEISEFTQTKEMLDGRVKTLHPKIHSGILFNRLKKKHRKEMLQNKFDPIDLVVVNFYPFEETIKKTSNEKKIIENIDIGGPVWLELQRKTLMMLQLLLINKITSN